MSWADLLPPASKQSAKPRKPAEATFCMTDGKGPWPAGHILTIRLDRMADAPAWLMAGSAVTVQIGGGEHAGSLRITPGGLFLLGKGQGKASGKAVGLRLAPLPGVAIERRKAAPCECEWADGWLEVTLPDWTKPGPPKARHVPLDQRVADPAAERRAAAAGARK